MSHVAIFFLPGWQSHDQSYSASDWLAHAAFVGWLRLGMYCWPWVLLKVSLFFFLYLSQTIHIYADLSPLNVSPMQLICTSRYCSLVILSTNAGSNVMFMRCK